MGHFYANGNVVAQDFTEAAGWYEKAAAQGNARAQYYFGMAHDFGIGVPIDYRTAFQSYMAAVNQNDVAAHLGIAGFHFTFRRSYMPPDFGTYDAWRAKAIILSGVSTNKPSFEEQLWSAYTRDARYWLNAGEVVKTVLQRAQAGDANSILDLARLVVHAQGVSRDVETVNSFVWQAAEAGSHHAMFILGALSELNKLIKDVPSRQHLQRAAESTEEPYFSSYYHHVCITESLKKTSVVTRMRQSEKILEKLRPHFHVLEKNAENGDAYAQYRLGFHLLHLEENDEKAYKLFECASNNGNHISTLFQGIMQLYGIGTAQNMPQGKACLDKAILYPDMFILYALRESIIDFHYRNQANTITVLSYLHGLDELNDANSAFFIGEIYWTLSRLKKNPYPWFFRANFLGCPQATFRVTDQVVLKKINIDETDFNTTHHNNYPGISLIEPNQSYLRSVFPAAENKNELAIACILDEMNRLYWRGKEDAALSLDYWIKLFLQSPQWYEVNVVRIQAPAQIDSVSLFENYFESKYGRYPTYSKINEYDGFDLHYTNYDE